MKELQVDNNDRILIIAPHPDDESIGVGGLIMSYPRQCTVIVMTDGGAAIPSVNPKTMKHIRKREFEEAMNYAGIEMYKMLGFPDGSLAMYPEAFREINISEFSLVFVPYEKEIHPDHLSVTSYVKGALAKEKDVTVFQYETRGPAPCPNFYLDITDCIDEKMELIRKHTSQVEVFDHASFVKAINYYQACRMNQSNKYYETYTQLSICECGDLSYDKEVRTIIRLKKENEIYSRWLKHKIEKRTAEDYLKKRGWHNVCIYGYGEIGKLLVNELLNSSVYVICALDRESNKYKNNLIDVFDSTYYDERVDVVIITILFGYEEVKEDLIKLGYNCVIHIQDIYSELERGS